MTHYEAEDAYLANVDQPWGHEYADTVGRFQEGFLRDGVCADLDDAFARAVDVVQRLLPAIKAKAVQ